MGLATKRIIAWLLSPKDQFRERESSRKSQDIQAVWTEEYLDKNCLSALQLNEEFQVNVWELMGNEVTRDSYPEVLYTCIN